MTQAEFEAWGLNTIGVSLFLLVALVLVLAHFNPKSRVDLTVLILDDKGAVSRSGFIALCGFSVSTWCVLHMELAARLDALGMLSYLGACLAGKVAGDAVAKMNPAGPAPKKRSEDDDPR